MTSAKLRIAGTESKPLPLRRSLTEASVKQLTCPAGKARVRVYDAKVKGLAVIITAKGKRSYYFSGRIKNHRTPVDFHLGDVESINLDTARTMAIKVAADGAQGVNPTVARQAAKSAAKNAISLQTLWERYRDEHLKKECRPGNVPVDESRFKNHLSGWANRRVDTITSADVAELHKSLTAKATGNTADKVVKFLRRMFTWSDLKPNPASNAVAFHGDQQIERFLTQAEIVRLLAALDAAPNQTIADAIRFMLLTGARRGNCVGAKWSDIHLNQAIWIIPASQSKSRKPMTIALSTDAVALLRKRPKPKRPSPYVFPGRRIGKPLTEVSLAWDAIRTAAKIEDVRLHDLRHTMGSWMAMSGASLLAIGKQLGHSDKRSSARYAHLELDAVRPATAAATAMMMPRPAITVAPKAASTSKRLPKGKKRGKRA